MKRLALILALALGACGANAAAIKQAEKACLAADEVSLKAKLAAGLTSVTGEAIALTVGEVQCALEALEAKAPATN